MPGLLNTVPISEAQQRANDKHRPEIVFAVFAVLFLYLYLFTHIADPLGIPQPEDLADNLGISIDHIFDDDRNVDSTLTIKLTQRFSSNDDERFVFFVVLAVGFVLVYFLPLKYKQPSLVLTSLAALLLLYGSAATAGLLMSHVCVYLVLHPHREQKLPLEVLAGLAAYWAFVHDHLNDELRLVAVIALPLFAVLFYRLVLLRLLETERVAPLLRTLTIQSAILTVGISALIEGIDGSEWSLPLGLLLFFWQWERLIMYHVDYKDGLVPKEIGFFSYLPVFFNPGVISNWNWGVTIGQGYHYVHNNFLCEDKNKLVLSGLKFWLIALIYIVFWDWIRHWLVDLFSGIGIPVYRGYTKDLVKAFARGSDISTASVLMTTLLDLMRWTMLWAGVVHFKVGVWRVCGYRVDPYIHHPWASTNMTTLWSRFTFHYREFLLRAFYYPVFFRFFKRRRYLRVFIATMAAACIGNLVWGHVPERLFYRGMELEHLVYTLGTWPYFVLLGAGISASQIYLMWRKRKRKPWTWDRWLPTDVIAAYCTIQYYALIHIFARPSSNSTVWDLSRLFLRGFGFHIEG